MGVFGEIRGYEYTFYVLAGVLMCSLTVAVLFMPNSLNNHISALPSEKILEQEGLDLINVQSAPIHGIAQRHSVDMLAVARLSARYSRRSHHMEAQINYKMFFTNLRAMTAIVSSVFAMIFMLFYEPVLTTYLSSEYHLSDKYFGMKFFPDNIIGYVLALGCFAYAISSPLVGMLCSKVPRRYITLSAFIFCGCSMFVFGPSQLFDIPP